MNRRWKRWLRKIPRLALAGAIGLAVGCGDPSSGPPSPERSTALADEPSAIDPTMETDGEDAAQPPSGEESAPPALPYLAPLTGLGSEREITERPVMVMVENSPMARPQSGLDEADLVYELLAEGDITRFAAVYQSRAPEIVGPVRSIRPYFVQIGDGLDALIVHAGWSQEAMNMIAERKLAHFDEVYGDGAYYWRSADRKMPHNLYTGIDKIRQGAVKKKYRETWNGPILHFLAPDEPVPEGSPATSAKIAYPYGYDVSYEYDAGTGLYLRFMEGEPHTDAQSGKQLSAANVLICVAKHRIVDSEGRRSIDVFGPNKGYLLQKGQMHEISWERREGIIRAYANGKEFPLIPGQTWIQVVPEGTGITVQ